MRKLKPGRKVSAVSTKEPSQDKSQDENAGSRFRALTPEEEVEELVASCYSLTAHVPKKSLKLSQKQQRRARENHLTEQQKGLKLFQFAASGLPASCVGIQVMVPQDQGGALANRSGKAVLQEAAKGTANPVRTEHTIRRPPRGGTRIAAHDASAH